MATAGYGLSAPKIEPRVMRSTMGSFVTGVAVVTTRVDAQVFGMTVNSLTSVSLDPPLLLVCLLSGTRTAEAVRRRGMFVVNILRRDQQDIAVYYARAGGSRGGVSAMDENVYGIPFVSDALARCDCRVHNIYDGGDHTIIVGKVESCESGPGAPLVYARGTFAELANRDSHLWCADAAWQFESTW